MTLKTKLALSVITRNTYKEIDKFRQMLDSVQEYVGKTYVTVTLKDSDDKIDKALNTFLNKRDCIIDTFIWCNDFSKARNANLAVIKEPYVLWLDTDDILIGGEKIAKNLEVFEKRKDITSIWYDYNYDHDKDGNCTLVLPRERIFRKDWHEWKGKIHENAICKYQHLGFMEYDVVVKHNNSHAETYEKAMRNIKVSLMAYQKEKEEDNLDPKTPYDVARALVAVGSYKEAEQFFAEFLGITRSDQDYYDALIRLTNIHLITGELQKATQACTLAVDTKFNWPDAYILMAQIAMFELKHDKALHWLNVAEKCYIDKHCGLAINPLKYTADLWKLQGDCLWHVNKPEEALKKYKEAIELKKSSEELKNNIKRTEEFLNFQVGEKGALVLKDLIEKEDNHEDKLESLINSLPDIVADHPVFVRLRNKFNPEIGKDRLVFYCHSSFEEWGPSNVNEGIGGSEEATINLAKELVKLGWRVEVYNQCSEPGMHEGVKYNHYDQFDRSQPCEVFIAWRMWEYLKFAPAGSYKVLWCHDKQDNVKFPPDFSQLCDKIFVLSEHHRLDLSQFPDEAIYVTRNGIDPEQFMLYHHENEKNGLHDINKYIYASSPDRGLIVILENWERIKKINPKAELHIFYGFTATYDKLRSDAAGREFKENVMALIEKYPEIHYHGRVGHQELANWFMKCGFWLYPSTFTEISCITAMKAQAAGCFPITNDLAALKETLKFGMITEGCMYDEGVLDKWLNSIKVNPTMQKRQEMREWALQNLSWSNLAKDWSDRFKEWKGVKDA